MKPMLSLALFLGIGIPVTMSPFIYNSLSSDQRCEDRYDTSLNGLWIIKDRVCFGPLGMVSSSEETGRRAMFERF